MSSDEQAMNSMIGIQFEGFTVTLLKHLGFSEVHVTQATGDFGDDVIGKLNYHGTFGIQCKHTNGNLHKNLIGYQAVEEAMAGAKYYHLTQPVVLTNGFYTLHAIKGAKQNHVILWNGNSLNLLIKMFKAHLSIYDLMDYNHLILPFLKRLKNNDN